MTWRKENRGRLMRRWCRVICVFQRVDAKASTTRQLCEVDELVLEALCGVLRAEGVGSFQLGLKKAGLGSGRGRETRHV
jgi:hypothetical protein